MVVWAVMPCSSIFRVRDEAKQEASCACLLLLVGLLCGVLFNLEDGGDVSCQSISFFSWVTKKAMLFVVTTVRASNPDFEPGTTFFIPSVKNSMWFLGCVGGPYFYNSLVVNPTWHLVQWGWVVISLQFLNVTQNNIWNKCKCFCYN